jgi:hypothetical protein
MVKTIKLHDKEYEVENLSNQAKVTLASLQFANTRMQELNNMQALLHRAKNSYVESLKQEVLASKSGLLFEDD